MLQLAAAEWIFLYRLEKKDHLWKRIILAVVCMLAAVWVIPGELHGVLANSLQYLFLFSITILSMALCMKEPFSNLILCGIAGYTLQHLFYLIFTGIDRVLFRDIELLGVTRIDPYAPPKQVDATMNLRQMMIYIGIYGVLYLATLFIVYLIAFDIFDPLIQKNHNFKLGTTNLLCLSGLLITVDVISNMITNEYTVSAVSYTLEISYNIIICLMILALFYSELSRSTLRDELSGTQYILKQSKNQYEVARKTTELMNIKYHDLRHRSEQMGDGDILFREEKEELRDILRMYDVQFQTESDVLNVILTEKNIRCREKNAELLCMADGAGFDNMKPHHLYALLGNAIDNALEAVCQLPEDERLINLYIKRQGEITHIHIENPYAGEIMLRGGMPITRKADRKYHGYGMASMKTIAEQYNGAVSVEAKNGIFALDITLLLPKSTEIA